jgi:hypothetical protein
MIAKLQNGNTALVSASESGRFGCVKFLVENGANYKLKNEVKF